MKILKVILIILAILGLLYYLIFPHGLMDRGFWKPGWWEKSLFNFCKYETPQDFKVVSYSEGAPKHRDDQYLIILENQKTGQKIILSRVRGFHFIPFNEIELNNQDFGDPFRFDTEKILDDFKVKTHLPPVDLLRQDDQDKLPKNLILKGMVIDSKNQFFTQYAEVNYLKGSFNKIGFFKKMPFLSAFASTVFDFTSGQNGALAILNNKNSDETIIAISSMPSHKAFDEDVFKKFLATISFEKEVYKPALLEGINEPKPKANLFFKG